MLEQQMEIRALSFLKQTLAQAASKVLHGAWAEWHACWAETVEARKQEALEEDLMLQLDARALAYLKQQVVMKGFKGRVAAWQTWKSMWSESSQQRKQAEVEAFMEQQMEGKAIAHLKGRIAAQMGKGKQTAFSTWANEWRDNRANAQLRLLEQRLEMEVEAKALEFVKKHFAKVLPRAFVIWKGVWREFVEARQAAEIQATLEEHMESKGMSFLKMRLARQTKASLYAGFEAFKVGWLQLVEQQKADEAKLAQSLGMLRKFGVRLKQGAVGGCFIHWQDVVGYTAHVKEVYSKACLFVVGVLNRFRSRNFLHMFYDWKCLIRERAVLKVASAEQNRATELESHLHDVQEQAKRSIKMTCCQLGIRRLQLFRLHLVKWQVTVSFELWLAVKRTAKERRQKQIADSDINKMASVCDRNFKKAAMTAWKLEVSSTHLTRKTQFHKKSMYILGMISTQRILRNHVHGLISWALSQWVLVLVKGLAVGTRSQAEILHQFKAVVEHREEELRILQQECSKESSHAEQCEYESESLRQELQRLTTQLEKTEGVYSDKTAHLHGQIQELQFELEGATVQKAHLEARLANERSSEDQKRHESDALKQQLRTLQDDYEKLRRSSQGGDPLLLQLQKQVEQDRREKLRLRQQLNELQQDFSPSPFGSTSSQPQRVYILDSEIEKIRREIVELESDLEKVSGALQSQMSEIRDEGAALDLLSGATVTMDRGNTLTAKLEKLAAHLKDLTSERQLLLGQGSPGSVISSASVATKASNAPARQQRPSRTPGSAPASANSAIKAGLLFDQMDRNNDGVIDREEWKAMLTTNNGNSAASRATSRASTPTPASVRSRPKFSPKSANS